jgi:hypothetical protein
MEREGPFQGFSRLGLLIGTDVAAPASCSMHLLRTIELAADEQTLDGTTLTKTATMNILPTFQEL